MDQIPKFNWPKNGDVAITPGRSDRASETVIAFALPKWPNAYAGGFKSAADKLVDAAARDTENPDLLFFPIAFLYRHYLELSLKEIVGIGIKSGTVTEDKVMTEHNLHKLWNISRGLIESTWPNGNRKDNDAVEKVILEFHRLDKNGEAFRYPKDKQGNLHLCNSPDRVNLKGIKLVMEGVANYLDTAADGIDWCSEM